MNRIFQLTNNDRYSINARQQDVPSPRTVLEEKQAVLAHLVQMLVDGYSTGVFCSGTGGSGKSRTIQRVLNSGGVEPVLLNSHITPLSLYEVLYNNRQGRIIWLDDADSVYSNMAVLGLLRSALWGQSARTVTYTSSQLDEIPNSFTFESRIIMCANSLPRSEAFKAVLSRVDVYDLSLSSEEAVEQMRVLADSGYKSLAPSECHQVVSFIEQASGNRQLSMRVYEPSLKKVLYAKGAGIDWRELVESQLNQIGDKAKAPATASPKELDLFVMAQVVEQFPESVQQQQEAWCHQRQKSRASFFRAKQAFDRRREGD